MKVKVEKKFKDIHTEKIHRKGDVLEVTEKRYEEIMKVSGDLVSKVEEEAAGETDEKLICGHLAEDELRGMKVEELRKLAKDMGLDDDGKKEELVKRIAEEEVMTSEEPED